MAVRLVEEFEGDPARASERPRYYMTRDDGKWKKDVPEPADQH